MTIFTIQGVQKFLKIVINGSFFNTKFAVKRLDKKNTFREKNQKKIVYKISGGLLKNGLKGTFYLLFFGKNWTKSPKTKKMRKG